MFLDQTIKRNPALIDFALDTHRRGRLLPDCYLLDVDALLENAAQIGKAAQRAGITLYFMLKQVGRNPVLAQKLMETGYFKGAVAVDYREALFYIKHHIPLGNVGHLVQTPDAALAAVLDARPEIMTVYSLEKARRISGLAKERGFTQDIMLRVVGPDDFIYSGQLAGVPLEELEALSHQLKELPNIRVAGVCGFPCVMYDEESHTLEATPNANTVKLAAGLLLQWGHEISQLNMPSASCADSMPLIAKLGGTHAEPGHGLLGSTPYHTIGGIERQALVYLTEVSHNYNGQGYCYGGGYYRRGHLAHALVGDSAHRGRVIRVIPPNDDSIDYHLGLEEPCQVGEGVVMAFRTQIFVTRSQLALVEGLSKGSPTVTGIFDAFGNRLE